MMAAPGLKRVTAAATRQSYFRVGREARAGQPSMRSTSSNSCFSRPVPILPLRTEVS